jgi:hypothetical protein
MFPSHSFPISHLHNRILDIIRRIQPYDRRQECPRPKRAALQRRDVLGRCGRRVDGAGVVDARCELQGAVGLDEVADGD